MDPGYRGGLTNLIKFIRKQTLPAQAEPVVRFETEPGWLMQADWRSMRNGKLPLRLLIARQQHLDRGIIVGQDTALKRLFLRGASTQPDSSERLSATSCRPYISDWRYSGVCSAYSRASSPAPAFPRSISGGHHIVVCFRL